MFLPKFTISQTVLKNIGVIDASREVIASLSLSESWKDRLRKKALEETIFYTLSLEGLRLPEDYFNSENREEDFFDKHVENFKQTLSLIDEASRQFKEKETYFLTGDILLSLHQSISEGLISPERSGALRVRQIAIKNALTGEVTYSPPPAAEVPYIIEDLINWINSPEGKETHPIIKASIIHFEVYRIHPFSEFNSSIAVLLSLLLLSLDNYSIDEFFSFSEFFDATVGDYHKILQEVGGKEDEETGEHDLTEWVEYYTKGLTLKILELKEKAKSVAKESKATDHLGEQIELSERQVAILDYLKKHGSMRNKDFRKIFPDFSDDTVLREMKFLKKKGLVKKEGGTKKATYVLGQ